MLTAADCDDANDALLAIANDGDCDGLLTALDCDDADSSSNSIANDADCDGVVTALDCDDSNPSISSLGSDSSCPANSCKDILDQGASWGWALDQSIQYPSGLLRPDGGVGQTLDNLSSEQLEYTGLLGIHAVRLPLTTTGNWMVATLSSFLIGKF